MEYPKIKLEKYNPDDCERHGKEFKCLIVEEPKLPMDFKKFREIFDKRCIVIDEPTQIKPKPKVSINPTRESSWLKEFEKRLNDKVHETEI